MQYIDLTQTFVSEMPVFPGDPKPTLQQVAFLEKDSFNDHMLSTAMHVGTHMDAPLHMIDGGKKIDELDIHNFFGSGVLIDARGKATVDSTVLEGVDIPEGAVVLIFTGFGSKFHDSEYFEKSPAVTEDFAQAMVTHKVKIVGMDTSGPDHDQPWPTHKVLLGSGITILENLCNLDKLTDIKDFEVIALPAKLQADAAPTRVVAKIIK